MAILVSLLRGINIGGHHEIGMDALRRCHEVLGLTRVRTYGRSGNVVFDAGRTRPTDLGRRLEDAIETAFGFRPAIVLRTASELRRVVADNPFKQAAADDPGHVAVLFLSRQPSARAREELAGERADEAIVIGRREVFLYYPHGFEKARLTGPSVVKRLGVSGTARNWSTVTRLLALAEAAEEPD